LVKDCQDNNYKKVLTERSQKLRRNMTDDERHLWYCFLKRLPVSVRRQYVIGRYIVDFYIPSAKLVIELDGSEHYENSSKEYDANRDSIIAEKGITVIRYSNLDIKQRFDSVCEDISNRIDNK